MRHTYAYTVQRTVYQTFLLIRAVWYIRDANNAIMLILRTYTQLLTIVDYYYWYKHVFGILLVVCTCAQNWIRIPLKTHTHMIRQIRRMYPTFCSFADWRENDLYIDTEILFTVSVRGLFKKTNKFRREPFTRFKRTREIQKMFLNCKLLLLGFHLVLSNQLVTV